MDESNLALRHAKGVFMTTKGILRGSVKVALIAISSITFAGCFDNDGGTSAKANTDKALRRNASREKGIAVPDAGNMFVLLALAASGLVFFRAPRCPKA